MKPKPFALLNHFTVPFSFTLSSSEQRPPSPLVAGAFTELRQAGLNEQARIQSKSDFNSGAGGSESRLFNCVI